MRVHLNVGPMCENDCVFCVEEDRELRFVVNTGLTAERVRRLLERNVGAGEVCFTSGEPTLVPELPDFVRWARDLGYQGVTLITNGRRCGLAGTAGRLRDAGVTRFEVGLHGHTPEVHDALTRSPGSFEETVAGVRAVADLARDSELTLRTRTVVTRGNLPHLDRVYGFLRSLGVDQVQFQAIRANRAPEGAFEDLVPRYREVAASFRRLMAGAEGAMPPTWLADVPPCAMPEVPAEHRTAAPQFVQFELNDGAPLCAAAEQARPTSDGEFLQITRAALDSVSNTRRADCEDCVHSASCPGVWREYADAYGWEEFEPVRAQG